MITSLLHKHAKFDSVAYAPLSLLTNSIIEVYEPVSTGSDWDIDKGLTRPTRTPIYRGWAAITPNMDWRARDRRTAYDDVATHAYRVQVWHIDKNLLVPKVKWGDRSLRVEFQYGQTVKVVRHDSDPNRVGMKMIVRNAVTDSDWWQPTMLCDVDTGDMHGNTH